MQQFISLLFFDWINVVEDIMQRNPKVFGFIWKTMQFRKFFYIELFAQNRIWNNLSKYFLSMKTVIKKLAILELKIL